VSVGRGVAGALVALAATAGLVALSDVALVVADAPDAIVRLSWRAVGERIEECRTPSEEELASLPIHMRSREVCEGRLLPFRLQVRVDDALVIDREVRAAGAREDRPTYVFEEFALAPGPKRLEVSFASLGGRTAALRFDERIDPSPRAIVLVTRSEGEAGLVVRSDGSPAEL
jgi:hypothetical protein